MGLFRPGTSLGRPKTAQPDQSTLRGRISGPIPMDDEFPIRHPGAGIAHEGHPEQVESIVEERPISRSENTPSVVARVDKLESVTPSGPSQASNASASPQQQRTLRSSTLRYSTVSDSTDVDRPQRKKSTLKSTLGRLFKRKKKSTSEPFIPEGRLAGSGESAQHENDSNQPFKENESKRSASLPITEYDRALRSHSVGPDDMLAINSARNSLQVDPILLRRRAASSNRILSGRIRDFDGELIGLSPRPASTHGRDNHTSRGEDPDDIGRAITSDSRTHRRRSRSLSQLQDVAVSQVHMVRKRSDEIRYWRESYTAPILSPNSSTVNNDDTGVIDMDVDVGEGTPADPPAQISPKTPPQPFNFGPMIGMKITQAASLEDRIVSLEVHNSKLEKLVSQLFQVVPGVHNYVPATPDRAAPRNSLAQSAIYTPTHSAITENSVCQVSPNDMEQSSRFSVSRQSNESFGDGNTFIGSVPPSTVPRPRPTSNATIRGATSLPALLGESVGPFTIDHYTTLKALLDTERDARQVLEARVTKLNRKIDLISRTGHKLETSSTAYSTVSAFEHDDDDEPLTAGADTDSEAFKTPREEESGHGFGAFGEELRDEEEDGSRKKAARTLSLSQLTLKRPPIPQQAVGVDL
ncbi:hypothetical protein F4820DRAFT_53363 [Hypoxylon rubiginosum]|uniref:Uncharacterized protein n=1 Tax=Hypoxylon rubiginosum TaxID=110542 RepID=A0ACB9YRY8_9PEZI|nr:hypothetical protein F4820DRAFT_53363 [Hypoxylon rubiginosum]